MKKPKAKSIEEQEVALKVQKKLEMEGRVRSCASAVQEIMAKHRCQFAPIPKYRLVGDGWQLYVELNFKAIP